MEANEPERSVWYAMRATYSRNLEAKRLLEGMESAIETFIPMHYAIRIRNGRKKREFVPVIRDLLFVHTTPSLIKRLKKRIPYLIFLTEARGDQNIPIIVPDEQMRRFIAVANTYDDRLIYLSPDEIASAAGVRVRIHGGLFDGQEGSLLKLKKFRSKRVVIVIRDIIAVALDAIRPDLLEVIPDSMDRIRCRE